MEYCRICVASTAGDSKKVYNLFEGTEPLAGMIHELCGLQVQEDDGLPNIVCDACEHDLKLALKVKRKCLETDEKLRLIIKTESLHKAICEGNAECNTPVISYKILYEEIIEHTPPEIETTYVVESEPALIEGPKFIEIDLPESTQIEKPSVSQIENLNQLPIEGSKSSKITHPDLPPISQFSEQREVKQPQHEAKIKEAYKPYLCCGCEQPFRTKTELSQHSKEVHKPHRTSNSERPFECAVCYKRYTTYRGFKLHRRNVYLPKNHQCTSCGKKFTSRRVLENHERTHTKLKPFACSFCPKSFRSTSNLLSHLKLHSAIPEHTKHVCNICDKGFSRKSYLKYHHNLVHSQEMPFACSFCPSKFKANANLRLHLRTHTQERPYACDICEKAFMYPTDKKRHMLQHSGLKPFKCQDCDKAFTRKTLLQKHRTNCHKDEVSQVPK